MFRKLALAILILSPAASRAGDPLLDSRLSGSEREEIDQRVARFYAEPALPSAMARKAPKYDTRRAVVVHPNPMLRRPAGPDSSDRGDWLLEQAQTKASARFQRDRCDRFLKKTFPELRCEEEDLSPWATIEGNDRAENLAKTWLAPEEVSHSLDHIPVKGEVTTQFWSGDYWRMQWGLTSYRYSDGEPFFDYHKAVAAYAQPAEWKELLEELDPQAIASKIVRWSPAEKYDLTVGDDAFTMTNEQKGEGAEHLGATDNVESWFGICHGWAPAAIFVPPPKRSVTATGPRGTRVEWYPDDVKAMATLAWANGNFAANRIGGRCSSKPVRLYPNGRIADQECFDTNPASLHSALGSLIGKAGVPFVMDAAYDYEVWNQPILAYSFTYFNPLQSAVRSAKWSDMAVSYDETFKKHDRFQKPLTRGQREDGSYDDRGIKKIVGVIATVVYLAETRPVHGPVPRSNSTVRVTYTYDLELHEGEHGLVALGGEWHENTHPDFLWVPRRGSVATTSFDERPLSIDLGSEARAETTRTAVEGSQRGYPLCRVLEKLVEGSSGSDAYRCSPAR